MVKGVVRFAVRRVAVVHDQVELTESLFDELAQREQRPELLLVVEKRPVGHFGWFKQPLLWPDEVAWLLAAT